MGGFKIYGGRGGGVWHVLFLSTLLGRAAFWPSAACGPQGAFQWASA